MDIQETAAGPVEVWTPEEVATAKARNEIVLIDVRTPQEYMFEHIEGALLLPMAFFDPAALPSQEGKRIVLYCGSSMRSGKMAEKTRAAGVDKIAHLQGGFGKWKEAKQPYMGTDMSTGAPKKVTG
ncbi:Rhodanese-related sulfurtransferase [Pseudooceanicola nitratireducens]|jgi:rhodanese-related sulfurtransferase|uniref:Rhodanese-related sulfurtransferase n=1 Tax=Pseudooceanicola nitratireducens TaxID=517719 RepID=A0A1I1JHB2_9RHOB|nr:rhodanese-like domain-containing protein [Pseudooceanicola nitratireducens]SEJ55263.1 Rhodanese-related sulfurtransferase [Pseudooceanicola nitratireducens]SFC47352.1 Rhodanese-related sulfurtransferase [Pseudooceanicola nitratireducens]